ncbi:cobalamin biosynthesis Mg chelatase CobN [Streptacidiphilus sp. MAP12-33]|uniref:DUF3592 domain-containing protein n=1 Tax=Streptacidiphilus sp. MAP12-33 TaxID=3156266 RepID=UPI0035161C7D
MQRREGETTRRTVARWTVGLLFILSGLGAAAVNAIVGYEAGQLLAHGTRTSATVEQVTYGKNSDSAEITFTDTLGTEQVAWIDGVPHQYGVGDHITVVYDRNDPSNVSAVSTAEQKSAPSTVAFFALFGAIFVGVGFLTIWRGVPKGIGGWAYNRDYLPGARRRPSSPESLEHASETVD